MGLFFHKSVLAGDLPLPQSVPSAAARTGCGVLYIAFGRAFVREALISIQSLQEQSLQIPVTLMTDQRVRQAGIDVHRIRPRHIRSKVDFIGHSPYHKTLYLDSDTVVAMDVRDMFDVLDRFDVGITHDFARKRLKYAERIPEYARIPYAFPEANGGVMAFNDADTTREFLDLWRHYFYKYRAATSGWDQVSLRIALWESSVRLHAYPVEYNIRSQGNRDKAIRFRSDNGPDHLSPRIYHMHCDQRIHNGVFEVASVQDAVKHCQENAYRY